MMDSNRMTENIREANAIKHVNTRIVILMKGKLKDPDDAGSGAAAVDAAFTVELDMIAPKGSRAQTNSWSENRIEGEQRSKWIANIKFNRTAN
jgi:hypothetical protein